MNIVEKLMLVYVFLVCFTRAFTATVCALAVLIIAALIHPFLTVPAIIPAIIIHEKLS